MDAGYGRFRALFGVTLEVAEGSAVAIIGPNGAGKTTLARVCSALIRPSAGRVRFGGRDIDGLSPNDLARDGLVHVPEGGWVFASLTVEENLVLPFRQELGRRGVEPALAQAYASFPRLGERRRQLGGTLSGGEQRLLSLARVLTRAPRLLIADELTLGLDPGMVDEVYRVLARIVAAGTTVLVVEQRMARALDLADRVVLLRHGRVVREGPAQELAADAERLLEG
ncbi:MAG: ABC transporter ATP-binding protein [Acidimicrobiales bacterium]